MSWLKNSSIGASLGKLRSSNLPSNECDPSACYNSFKKHWQQIHEIIEKTKAVGNILKTDDDFLSVVNNLKKLVTFLSMELRSSHVNKPCLDYLLSQNLLDQLYTWSECTGRYGDTLKMQQMQLYEGLVDHSGAQLLIHEPFHRPLLKLLNTCSSQLFTVEVQKCLVVLLNQLCVSIYCQNELLDLFFFVGNPSRFIIFSLLLPFVHREGAIGQQARDALLLCVGLSSRNNDVAEFICRDSNFCQDLAAVLCCLYSGLPRKLNDIEVPDWHRFTPDDITEMPELEHFLNVLEFCNAVVQVAHPIVCEKLVQLLHGAFLCRVMGPALLQESVGVSLQGYGYSAPLQLSTEEELAMATAYFDLFLRSLSEPGLLNSFIKFLLKDTYEDQRIIDCVVMRIKSKTRLCVVTLSLLETLVELNCEDVMLELVLRHLVPCTHVMLSQRPRVAHVDPYCRSAEKFLSLAPAIPRHEPVDGSLYGNYQAYLFDARNKINSCAMATSCWTYQYDGENPPFTGMPLSRSEDGNANQKLNTESESADHSLPSADDGSSGYESFALKDGGRDCESGGECESPCASRNCSRERGENHLDNNYTSDISSVNNNGPVTTGNSDVKSAHNNGNSDITVVNNNGTVNIDVDVTSVKNNVEVTTGNNDLTSVNNKGTVTSGNNISSVNSNETVTTGNSDVTSVNNNGTVTTGNSDVTSVNNNVTVTTGNSDNNGSVGKSLNPNNRTELNDTCNNPNSETSINSNDNHVNNSTTACSTSSDINRNYQNQSNSQRSSSSAIPFRRPPSVYMNIFSSTPSIGPFLDLLFSKLDDMLSHDLYTNLRLTGLVSRLAIYPQPLIHSFLLDHSLVFQPSIRSLFQVLGSLKSKIEDKLVREPNVNVYIGDAQKFLLEREERLVNTRKHAIEAPLSLPPNSNRISDAFERGDSKRRSLSLALSSVFKRQFQPPNKETVNNFGIARFTKERQKETEVRNVVMCAVILDEWLKELAAITQEHTIYRTSL